MRTENAVYVKCLLAKGGFPTERLFLIAAPGGGVFKGIAAVEYCWTSDLKPAREEPSRGSRVEGYISAIELERGEANDLVRVYLPDGDVCEITSDLIQRPKEPAHVPVES